jgi:hypothetical protein
VKQQRAYFKRAPRFHRGEGLHLTVILLQNAGPGFLLDRAVTEANFWAAYAPRLDPGKGWTEKSHNAEKLGEAFDRAWNCEMDDAAGPNDMFAWQECISAMAKSAEKARQNKHETEREAARQRAKGAVKAITLGGVK